MLRPRITGTARTALTIVATVALCATSSAFAAAKITGAHIANGTVTGVDVKNNSIGTADIAPVARKALRGQMGPAGAPGPAGPAGAQGVQGPAGTNGINGHTGQRGVAAWDTIPSGTTVTGSFMERRTNDIAGSNGIVINLPAQAPAPLIATDVNLAPSDAASDPNAACSGSYLEPTAPAGKVCIYPSTDIGVEDGSAMGVGEVTNDWAFRILWTSLASNINFSGTWAYKAP